MAASSASSIDMNSVFDVFLCFLGEDTRYNFVDYLYAALDQRGIRTYKDGERFKQGNNMLEERNKSIEHSKFYIIVFSKNFAASTRCLDELAEIMNSLKIGQFVYPVYYGVQPSEVRSQTGAVGKAFDEHKNNEAAKKWREALKEAASLVGWVLNYLTDGHGPAVIKEIVDKISLRLLDATNFTSAEELVGMKPRIKDIESCIAGLDDVRLIGIKGMGGVGKTTLARAIYDKMSIQFEGKSFVENISEVSGSASSGLKSLQEKLLSEVLCEKGINVRTVHDGKHMMKMMLCNKKVLVVLDDVDHIDQLEALAGNWFRPGSIIIITARDEIVLRAHGAKLIYDVPLLSDKESMCLFSRLAFRREIPIQDFKELSGQVVRYAAGLLHRSLSDLGSIMDEL